MKCKDCQSLPTAEKFNIHMFYHMSQLLKHDTVKFSNVKTAENVMLKLDSPPSIILVFVCSGYFVHITVHSFLN